MLYFFDKKKKKIIDMVYFWYSVPWGKKGVTLNIEKNVYNICGLSFGTFWNFIRLRIKNLIYFGYFFHKTCFQ